MLSGNERIHIHRYVGEEEILAWVRGLEVTPAGSRVYEHGGFEVLVQMDTSELLEKLSDE